MAEIDTEIEAIAEAEGEDSERIEPLSDERDAITEALRIYTPEQKAIGGVALWVSRDGSLGQRVYRAKAEPRAEGSGIAGPAPPYGNSLLGEDRQSGGGGKGG